jgi:hypothetical protein
MLAALQNVVPSHLMDAALTGRARAEAPEALLPVAELARFLRPS